LSLIWLLLPAFLAAPAGLAVAQVYVANNQSGTVSVISTPGNTVVKEIPVGSLPQAVAITPDGRFVYVSNRNSGTLSKIDTSSDTVVANINVGFPAEGVTVSPDGTSVFVLVGTSLIRLSVATNGVTGTFPLPTGPPGGQPVDVAVTPNGQFAYVVDRATAICSVYPIDLATGAIINTSFCTSMFNLPGTVGGSFPRAVRVRPDGQFVYVTAFQDGALQVVRVSDNVRVGGGCVLPNQCLFGGPIGVAVSSDSNFAFTANSNVGSISIFTLSPTSGLPSLPINVPVPNSPQYLDVTRDGRLLYVTHGANSVSVIDLQAIPPSVIQTITVGSFPQGIAVSPLASSGGPPTPPPPPPPALSASLVATPSNVTVGDGITVTMTVSNTGGSAASGVSASALSKSGSGDATFTSGPTPGPTTIAAGASQAYTYTYLASVAGSVTFSGNAAGGGVSSNTATSNAVTIVSAPSPPTLSVTPASLNAAGELGLADPPSQSLTIANVGSGALAWTATGSTGDGNTWLSLNPGTGSASPSAMVSVSASTCGLPVGTYSGAVTVVSAGAVGSPQSVPITLSVLAPGSLPPGPLARLCLDRPLYRPGDTLHLRASLRRGAASNSGDAYVFTQVPGTSTVLSLVLSEGLMVPVVGTAPVPLATNFSVFDFAGEFFNRPFAAGDPEGSYTVTAILALPNSDPLIPANQLAVATTSFTFAH
jgi:YVTN family beta-propeller protein